MQDGHQESGVTSPPLPGPSTVDPGMPSFELSGGADATGGRTEFRLVLAALIQAFLSEPARGGRSRLPVAAGELPRDAGRQADALPREVRRAAVTPHSEQVLHDDPTRRSLWWAIRYGSRSVRK